jgi:hypothetical protein
MKKRGVEADETTFEADFNCLRERGYLTLKYVEAESPGTPGMNGARLRRISEGGLSVLRKYTVKTTFLRFPLRRFRPFSRHHHPLGTPLPALLLRQEPKRGRHEYRASDHYRYGTSAEPDLSFCPY